MSLGITSIWRARPLRLGPSIHHEPLFTLRRAAPYPLARRQHRSILAGESEQVEARISNDEINAKRSKFYKSRKKSEAADRAADRTAGDTENGKTSDIKDIEDALERSHFAGSVFLPPIRPLPSPRERRRLIRSRHKAVTAQVLHERDRQNFGGRPADWRMVLDYMAKITPESSLVYIEDGIEIDVDRKVLAHVLQSTGDNNFGALRRRTGTIIKVSRDESSLLLSGTRQAINMATEEIRNMAGRITVTRRYRPLEPGESETEELGDDQDFFIPSLTREEGAFFKKKRTTQHVFLTPLPTEWTAKAVRDYVIALVDSCVDPALHSPLYVPTYHNLLVDHERAVVHRLMRLFIRWPLGSATMSCSLVKLAMSFMAAKGDKYEESIKHLFVILDRREVPMDTDLFNIMLRAHVKTRNLRKFRMILKIMEDRGFAPNLDTWILFLRIFESIEVKSYILQAMNAKNLLNVPRTIQLIAQEMASYDANHAVAQGKDLAAFLRDQEARYGPDWLTRDAGNKVLHVLGEYMRYEDAFKLLDLMGEQCEKFPRTYIHERLATRPDAKSFTAILNHARIERKVPLAVNIIRKMKTRKLAVQPSATILDLLFDVAWRSQLRTSIVVIWRYACLARLTSYTMRRRVSSLLSGDLSGPTDRRLSANVYHKLGGEVLARELAGGPEALEQIKVTCRRVWGDINQHYKLGSIVAKILPLAFDGYGPGVALGDVLSQSVLVDYKCLRARKNGQLKELLASAKVKSIPLWKRQSYEETWTDVAPLDPSEPSTIKHNDVWEEEWDSEGWNPKSRIVTSEDYRQKFMKVYQAWQAEKAQQGKSEHVKSLAEHLKSKADEGEADEMEEDMPILFAKAVDSLEEKRLAIINPRVWDDEKRDLSVIVDDHRTGLQRQNEEAILQALEQVRSIRSTFRYVYEDDETISMVSEDGEHGTDSAAHNENEADSLEHGTDSATQHENEVDSLETEPEARLRRMEEMVMELKMLLQKDEQVHDSEADSGLN